MTEEYGNPSSLHSFGQSARKILRESRETIAALAGVRPAGVVFTSGGTEADNLAFAPLFRDPSRLPDRRILISAVEHPAVSAPAERLAALGAKLLRLPCFGRNTDTPGMVNLAAAGEGGLPGADLISVMAVNNEIGTVQPVAELCRLVRALERAGGSGRKTLIHSDAVQAFGKLRVAVAPGSGAAPSGGDAPDMISVSAHKIYGPKGVGALCCARPEKLFPLIFGGGQEDGIRSGTENTAGIAGFATAAREAENTMRRDAERVMELRAQLLSGILDAIPDALINSPRAASAEGTPGTCSPYILNVSFPGTRGEVLVHDLESHGIYVSTGSACSSIGKKGGNRNSSLKAIGLTDAEADAALRFSFSRDNTAEEIGYVLERLTDAVRRFRRIGTYR
jgi:cysteine desulfurase